MKTPLVSTRIFGKTGQTVTRVGLGGEGVLRTFGQIEGAQAVIWEAINQGITYFDSARAYAGSEGYYGSIWPSHPETRASVFQASKSASRDRDGAVADLGQTLSTMGLESLDLWQIHDVRTEEELQIIGGPGGALEAFLEAKAIGKTRFIGVTGHHDPYVLTTAVREWPVDSVMMPVNPVEGALGGFLDLTLPAAREKGIAIIGMKVLGASHYILPELDTTPELLTHYALSQDITVAIVGCSTPHHVRTLVKAGQYSEPLPAQVQQDLIERFRPHTGQLAYYRGVI
ncbi:MAG: aldo/keto reductase [Proteobacteria bacterium]|nr:aldo/keto reductase [Pseudomonadota bacterium]